MSDERSDKLKAELVSLKKKVTVLKTKITKATGPTAGKVQQEASESIEKHKARMLQINEELEAVEEDDVSIDEVLEMIENAGSVEELEIIEAKMEGEVPIDIVKAIGKRKTDILRILAKNKATNVKDLPWVTIDPKEIVAMQIDKNHKMFGRLASFDSDTGKGQLLPE